MNRYLLASEISKLVKAVDEFQSISKTEVEICFKTSGSVRLVIKDLETGERPKSFSFKTPGRAVEWLES